MSRRRDKIAKLRRLAESPNPHEAARAREAVARLSEGQAVEPEAEQPELVFLGVSDGVRRYAQPAAAQAPANGQLPMAMRHPRNLRSGR